MERGQFTLNLLKMYTNKNKVDICRLTETNTNWSEVPYKQQLQQHTRTWWECAQWTMACNWLEKNKQEYQPGGTTMVVLNQIAHQAMWPGEDNSGLGRWGWTKLKAKGGSMVRIYTAYQLCKSSSPLTTYQQHQWYLAGTNNPHRCLRDVFWEDLIAEVQEAQVEGEQIIIMADINEDIKGPVTKKYICQIGLVEALMTLHKTKPPQTHQRGQEPIDRIFLSESLLEGAKGGYLEFDNGLGSDHRGIWLLPAANLFGDPNINYTPAKARRLQCKDPRIIKNTQKHWRHYWMHNNSANAK